MCLYTLHRGLHINGNNNNDDVKRQSHKQGLITKKCVATHTSSFSTLKQLYTPVH